ncbi:lipopolysaccharide assembly protein LapA domain-containing protein [Aliterella atlantica]|uniref:Lipopolysaccharide assembly protein A domain-containing protein n=1 Tax=Aliterella atlantica CENA595 TaxID=1618023 RepID=A0A0D8ZRX0_9CYAN|nr:lipopolysaccharide assembly protein LapA domain-containing protein [Aliterella atlantica]KJH71097.1 hypothetical protein UH38_13840 [Aliterella atlantica CENA595]
MRTTANLVISLAVAFWVIAIAVISLKNVTPISLKFLTFESIQLPFFLVIAFSVCAGIILMALIQPLWSISGSRRRSYRADDFDEDDFSFNDKVR